VLESVLRGVKCVGKCVERSVLESVEVCWKVMKEVCCKVSRMLKSCVGKCVERCEVCWKVC